ncbi:MAG: response regulator [Polyangiaceae bacterium]
MLEGSDRNRRVILVDDDPSARRAIGRMVRLLGLDVEEVSTAAGALDLTLAYRPDVVLTDLRMPGMDGVELIRKLRERSPGLPIVAMSAFTELDAALRALRAGASDFIAKPIQLDDLMVALDRAVAAARSDAAALALENMRLLAKLQEVTGALARAESSQRATEERLAQAQRMEALGRLASGVAHDFNNVLSVVIGYGDLMLEEEPLTEAARVKVQGILKAARHGAALTGQLLAFGRQQVMEPRLADLNDIVGNMLDLLQSAGTAEVSIDLDLAGTLGKVRVDPSKMGQVVMNLLINARDSMPNGGRITIRTADERPPGATRPHAMIAITDTGTGMDAATSSRIFEPFFTTKAIGKGTGLGLATVLGIVEQSEGQIAVDSHLGEGSTFKVYLPHAQAEAPRRSSRPKIQRPRGPEVILLVDDDDDVRVLTARILERGGYRVLAASTPAEARSLAAAEKEEIALLLTDIVMPDESGLDLAQELTTTRPAMRVVYMSGYAEQAITTLGQLPEGCAFLQKPIAREALLAKVRAELAPPSSAPPHHAEPTTPTP